MIRGGNVILVTVDSLRADYCGHHGGRESTTPTLDQLAREGVVFERAIAPGPRTPDSVPAIFTGTSPKMGDRTLEQERELIRKHLLTHQTIPERLEKHGYETAALTPNPYASRYFGYDQLFHHFEDFMDEDRSKRIFERTLEEGSTVDAAARLLLCGLQRESVFKPWEAYYDELIQLTCRLDEPYFIWVFPMDCHMPYLAGSASRTQFWWESYYANLRWYWNDKTERFRDSTHERLETAYRDSVRHVDKFLMQLLRDVEDTRLVVTADHGEAFYEHGIYGHPPDHFYEENLHVPLVVHDGIHQDTVKEVVSLRKLPELLSGGYKDWDSTASTVATASSLGSEGMGVWGTKWGYTEPNPNDDDADAEVHFFGEDDAEQSDATIRALGRSIVEQRREAQREQSLITDATKSLDSLTL